MWNPIDIEFFNLFSHKHSKYAFKQNECVVIFGKNNTDRNFDNNGAGKTTLFEAICISLTNESLRGLKKENFINENADSCRIIHNLYNPALNMSLKIDRTFFKGSKPVKIEIWENGVINKEITSVAEANKRVAELIGIEREDLLKYYIISQDNRYTFFTASDSEKKEIMNRITSADMVNSIIEKLSENNKKTEKEINKILEDIHKFTAKKETLEEQKEEILDNDDTKEQIENLKEKISDVEEKITSVENLLSKLNKNASTSRLELSNIKVSDVLEIKEKRKKIKEEIEKLNDEISEAKRLAKNLQNELNDAITCPNCEHEFILDSTTELSIEEIKEVIEQTNGLVDNLEEELKIKKMKLILLNEKIQESEDIAEQYKEKEDEIKDIERKINFNTKDLSDYRIKKKNYQKDLVELKNKKEDNKLIKSIDDNILEYQNILSDLEKKLLPLQQELDLIKFWQFNMGRSGFQTYLANKSIKIIEGITNSFLRKFNVDISVLINGFTVLKSGEVREKIDVFVSNDGVTIKPFMAKSGGERGRVTLAGILGIQNLINLSTNGRGLNLLLFDECFHGMDSKGQENIIKIFEKMKVTTMVITQNVSESFNNKNTLYVVKENNVSKYIS